MHYVLTGNMLLDVNFLPSAGLVTLLKTAIPVSSNLHVDCCPTQGVNHCMLHDVEKQKLFLFCVHLFLKQHSSLISNLYD